MTRTKKLLLLLCVFLAVLAIPLFLVLRNETHLSNTDFQYKFRQIYPVDPYDPMRGKYITLHYLGNSVESEDETINRGEDVYVVVDKDEQGWAFFKSVSKKKPDVPNYFLTKATSAWNSTVRVNIPFDRYYMNESLAPLAEQEYNRLSSDRDTNLYVVVTIKDGEALLNELYYKDQLFKEYLKGIQESE